MQETLIIGSPNSGKSLLFNRLTGLNHKVANFPGVTVHISSGAVSRIPGLTLHDFPGVYSLLSLSEEERVAVKAFKGALKKENLNSVICILDATRLEKSLYFATQVIRQCHKEGKQVVVVANMVDILAKHNMNIDTEALANVLGAPVLQVSAKTGEGVEALNAQLQEFLHKPVKQSARDWLSLTDAELRGQVQQWVYSFGPQGDLLVNTQTRLDNFFLHSWWGGAAFFAVMYLLFQSIFTWAAPLMDAVEAVIEWSASLVLPSIEIKMLHDFTQDALFGGLGAFLVFVPQIFILTLVIGILEDSGYLARTAVICHKPLRMFGLTGKSFVPMLSGVACAIPGIYAARTIDSPLKRWLTYFAIPLMPCSARLPVYTLLIAVFIPAQGLLGGLIGMQGFAMFAIYLFGIVCGLIITAVLSRSRAGFNDDLPFVLEMPPYRLPGWQPLLRNAWNRSLVFVYKAGPIIFMVTIVVWLLGYFPNNGGDLSLSWLAKFGHFIEPVFEPLGLDWRYGVAILTSFLAREVFVGTLGTLFGLENSDENITPLVEQIQNSGLTLASGLSLLVFFAIAMQCVSTLAVLGRESGSIKLPIKMFIAYGFLAYGFAWIVFRLFS